MNRSVLFLSVGALLLASACAKQEHSATSPTTEPAPADQALPPATDSTTPPADSGAATPPADQSTTPPADSTATPPAQDPNASPPPR